MTPPQNILSVLEPWLLGGKVWVWNDFYFFILASPFSLMPTVQGYDFLKSSLCPSPPCARQSLETNANTFVVYNPQLFTLRWCMLLQRLMKIAVEAKMCPNCFLNFRTRWCEGLKVDLWAIMHQVFLQRHNCLLHCKRGVGGPKSWSILKLYWSIALSHLSPHKTVLVSESAT